VRRRQLEGKVGGNLEFKGRMGSRDQGKGGVGMGGGVGGGERNEREGRKRNSR